MIGWTSPPAGASINWSLRGAVSVLHAASASEALVTTQNDQSRKTVLPRLLGVAQAEVERVLGREERDDAVARHVGSQVRDQMTQVVLFLQSDSAVRQEHSDVLLRQCPHGMVGIDPGVHALERSQFGSRRSKFGGNHGLPGLQSAEERHASGHRVGSPVPRAGERSS